MTILMTMFLYKQVVFHFHDYLRDYIIILVYILLTTGLLGGRSK